MSPPRTAAPVQTVSGAIVFTDIAGFTEFTAARGDEAALALLALQERLVREEMDDLVEYLLKSKLATPAQAERFARVDRR